MECTCSLTTSETHHSSPSVDLLSSVIFFPDIIFLLEEVCALCIKKEKNGILPKCSYTCRCAMLGALISPLLKGGFFFCSGCAL